VLRNGFARVKCKDCNHEYLLAFSCKRLYRGPGDHQGHPATSRSLGISLTASREGPCASRAVSR
jgi:hypothetical protein